MNTTVILSLILKTTGYDFVSFFILFTQTRFICLIEIVLCLRVQDVQGAEEAGGEQAGDTTVPGLPHRSRRHAASR